MNKTFEQETIEVFINSLERFYQQINLDEIEIGVPYLLDSNEPIVEDFTGIIGISGQRKGCVYYTCPRAMLSYILIAMGENEVSNNHLCDLAGEIANTIAGNARKFFGAEFLISVPVVLQGEPEKINLPQNTRCIVIPTKWKFYESIIVVALE
ncbi:chemotaxis protein CheX [Neptuniibacter sp. SY11_33]|uniref:chemotaxis protein CheX n=1 Tax=Neptuniibacter sp. SY11_33 TaxID=3398215 RepID=UPI0039F4FDF4